MTLISSTKALDRAIEALRTIGIKRPQIHTGQGNDHRWISIEGASGACVIIDTWEKDNLVTVFMANRMSKFYRSAVLPVEGFDRLMNECKELLDKGEVHRS